MTIRIERGRKKSRRRRKKRQSIGFTNRLALYLMLFLAAGLAGGFVLAWRSIEFQYMGALACFTVVFTPVGTAIGIVLNSIVRKSDHENTGADGEGIKYAAAMAAGFVQADDGVEEDSANVVEG